MAILDRSKRPQVIDRDENVFIGIDLTNMVYNQIQA